MSVTCPNCSHSEMEGALFCSECGNRLMDEGGISTAAVRGTDPRLDEANSARTHTPEPPAPAVDSAASLHIVRTGQILPLVGRDEFTIGRVSEGQSILPDIDLTPYEAYSQGVSRLHATIKIATQGIQITDLGSSNGTRINNERLNPHKQYSLHHGDVIALGRFKIQALIRQD